MRVLIDTNVIVDVLQERHPFAESAIKVMNLIEMRQVKGFLTASSLTDLHYILKRSLRDASQVNEALEALLSLLEVIDVTTAYVRSALQPDVIDFEDELIAVCAAKAQLAYIVTRKGKDFASSAVPAITPDDFLEMFWSRGQA